ncbi:MAG: copper amine oxidase N-terminal domain-containing protein [Ruminococcaceae bacterium]|nr:copper amine oxidase N-terminal domain-containing protein [Oscillospiraceae bacterium]
MKKVISVVLMTMMLLSLGVTAFARKTSVPITFYKEGKGRFIYENNIESIRREDLSDKSNPQPKYIMKNKSLKPGKFSVFITNLNATGIKDESGKITEPGFDIEMDALFETDSYAKVKITALGFEVPEINTIYSNSQQEEYEETWSCMNAWADYLDMPIYQKDNFRRYMNIGFTEKEFSITNESRQWLSEFIDNYKTVPYLKPVNILLDFEVVSGVVDFNICALKSTGVLKDRSNHDYSAPEQPFTRDRQYKGIADTLPKVTAKIEYDVDYSDKDGDLVDMMVYNQYRRAGQRTEKWVTNLNPQNDPWSKEICAESDMIVLKLYDDEKLDMYGTGVGDLQKDRLWYFDVYHADNTEMGDDITGKEAKKYEPNQKLDRYTDNYLRACNLGNYGVRVCYDLIISNGTRETRYFDYIQETGANNIVLVYDEKGNPMTDYAICKGNKPSGALDVMASIELPAGKKTRFTIETILPANNNGGTLNSFRISKQQTYAGPEYDSPYEMAKGRLKWTGEEYYKFEKDKLYFSKDGKEYTEKTLSQSAKDIFGIEGNNYKIVNTDSGYMAKWGEYDGAPAYFQAALDFYSKIYMFDEEFNLKDEVAFPKFPTRMSFSDGIYYVTAGDEYYSTGGMKWLKLNTLNPPKKANGLSLTSTKYGYYFIKSDEMDFTKLDFEDKMPKYVMASADIFYYTDKEKIYVSKTGQYWDEIDAGEDILTIDIIGNEFVINGYKNIPVPQNIKEDVIIKLNHEIPVSKERPYLKNGKLMIDARKLFEKSDIGYKIEEDKLVFTKMYDEVIVSLKEKKAYKNGEEIAINEIPDVKDGRFCLPFDFLTEAFGYEVKWQQNEKIVEFKTN